MKVLLLAPPAGNMIHSAVPEVVDLETGAYPPLGLLYVAAFAEKETSHRIEVLDAHLEEMSPTQIGEEVRKRAPDVVGIQTLTFTLIDVILAAKAIKQARAETQIVLGGPHVSLFPDETIDIEVVDYLILGEGEEPFAHFLDVFAAGGDFSKVPGLVWRRKKQVLKNPPAPLLDNLDRLPHPARHLVPSERYFSALARELPITTMMSSRGCPYPCIFCDRPHLGKTFRARSAQSVVEEMELCVRMGIREIFFYDDTFSINRKRVIEICDALCERKVRVAWDIRARVNTLDEEVLDRLAEAGCARIHMGVEAGTEEITRVLRKGNELLKDAPPIFAMAAERGITTLAYFMIGNPTETRAQIEQTVTFAKNLGADFAHFSVTTPYPGTELYRLGLQRGILPRDYWREFARNPAPGFRPLLWEEVLTRNELIDLLSWAYKSFYRRPSYLIRRLLKVRSLSELRRQARMGIKLLAA
jgi:radical SAM superfamily enzyme YgiQ (UPF0313 family)